MDIPNINLSFWILQTFAMLLTALILPGLTIDGPLPALITVITLSFINSHVWDAALFFKIPDSLTSQALLLLVSNGVIFWVVVKLLPGIGSKGLIAPLVAPILFTISSLFLSRYASHIDWVAVGKAIVHYMTELRTYLESTQTATVKPSP